MSDDIVTRLREQIQTPLEFADEGAPAHLIAEAADEIERLRKLMSDFVSLHIQADQAWIGSPDEYPHEILKAYYAKFHEMKEAVRGD